MSNDVEKYYNEFMHSRMLSYRIDGNRRLDAASKFLSELLRPNMSIADIGCGIGIISERLGLANANNTVIGVDISSDNIEYARRTVNASNVSFISASITEQFSALKKTSNAPFDMIIMTDVIEHIPEEERSALFHNLADVGVDGAILAVTYPSPEYQRYLVSTHPEELQVIDNVVEIKTLIEEADAAGWMLSRFSYVDVWQKNQYCHAAFARCLPLEKVVLSDTSAIRRPLAALTRKVVKARRRRKYLTVPFRDWPSTPRNGNT
ncbi:MAG: class I SAM-dependent methyltransferase [Pseudomonadota bacterium]